VSTPPSDDEIQRLVVAQWRAAAPALAAQRRAEVAALSDEDALAATLDPLDAIDLLPPLPPRRSSGLVEQRLFARGRRT
jgi:hypothetical protein